MVVYGLVFFAMFFLPYVFNQFTNSGRKLYCIAMTVILACLYGFRSEFLGMNDVEFVYMPMLQKVQSMSWQELFEYYPVFRGNALQILSKIFMDSIGNRYIWLFISGLPFIIAMSYAINKYSKYPSFSYFMLFGTYIYLVNMFLIRHSIAMAVLIVAYGYIEKKKPVKFMLMVLLAATFHTTAIVFLVAYPLTRIRFNWKVYLGSLALTYFVVYNGNTLFSALFTYLQNDYYSLYVNALGSSGLMYFTRYCFLFLIMLFLYMYNKEFIDLKRMRIRKNMMGSFKRTEVLAMNSENALRIMMCLCVVFMSMTAIVAEFYRFGMFFGVFGVLGLSNELARMKDNKIRFLLVFALYVIYGVYIYNGLYAANLAPYESWL